MFLLSKLLVLIFCYSLLCEAQDGAPGAPGQDGSDGADGANGSPGADGSDGAPGAPDQPGQDGGDGAPGQPGSPGQDGADGADGAPGALESPWQAVPDGEPGTPGQPGADSGDGADGDSDSSPGEVLEVVPYEVVTIQAPTGAPVPTTSPFLSSTTSPTPTYTKMIKTFGKVISPSPTRRRRAAETDGLSVAECIDECFYNSTCILAYMDTSEQCRMYYYTEGQTITVEETTNEDGEVVAFKADLEDFKCPLSYEDATISGITVTLPSGGLRFTSGKIIRWTRTSSGWTISM